MSARDDEEEISRQATVLAHAEELSREHSQRRSMKRREERVRTGANPKKRDAGARKTSDPTERAAERDEASARRAKDDSGRRKGPAKPRARPKGVDDPLRANVREPSARKGAPGESNPRLSDPFPPIRKKARGTSSAANEMARGPDDSRHKTQESELPSRNKSQRMHSGPYRTVEAPSTASDKMAMELEELVRRFRSGWRSLGAGSKIVVLSACMMLAGVFMPWVSLPGRAFQPGLFSGGLIHAALAVVSLRLVVLGFASDFEFSSAELHRRRARHSLYIVLLGALSTAFGAYLLLMWGLQKGPGHSISFHFGLYWTLACGTGVSYGGFARFGDGGSR